MSLEVSILLLKEPWEARAGVGGSRVSQGGPDLAPLAFLPTITWEAAAG